MAAYKKADDRKKNLNFVRKLMKTKNDKNGLKGQKLKIDESKISEVGKSLKLWKKILKTAKAKARFYKIE